MKDTAQYIEIDSTYMSLRFHCPACGAEVMKENGEPATDPCEHLLFSWLSEGEHFLYVSDKVADLIDEVQDEYECFLDDEAFLSRCPDSALLFSLTWSESLIPPTTTVHAIDFPTVSDNGQSPED